MKKISLFVILFFPFLQSQAVFKTSYCFNSPITINCVDQQNGNFSLEGYFEYRGQSYTLTARRAYEKNWCFSALDKISSIMSVKEFCIEAEITHQEETQLTIENFSSSQDKWSYFLER